MSKTNNQAAIVGIGQTEFSKTQVVQNSSLPPRLLLPPAKMQALIQRKSMDASPTLSTTLMKLTFYAQSGVRN